MTVTLVVHPVSSEDYKINVMILAYCEHRASRTVGLVQPCLAMLPAADTDNSDVAALTSGSRKAVEP